MTVSSTEGVTNGIFAPVSATSSTSSYDDDSDMFLNLMVAELKYQDPMNPADTSDMMQQEATSSEVSSMEEIQSEMGQLLSAQLAFGAASMVGQQVSWTDADGNVQSGTVQGTTFTASGPTLSVGDQTVALTSVTDVGTTNTTTAASGDTSSTQS